MALVVQHVYQPIPDRRFDWAAYDENELCCDECPLMQGFGPTELDAILDWLEQRDERRGGGA